MELKNQKGISVIEVIIAMVLITVAFFGVLEFLRGTYNRHKQEEQVLSFQQRLLAFDAYLSDPNNCRNSLSGNPSLLSYTGGTISLNHLRRTSGNLFQRGARVDGFTVNDIRIRPTVGIPMFTNNGLRYYLVDMHIDARTSNGSPISSLDFPFRFAIYTDTANRFLGCSRTVISQTVLTCKSFGSPLAGYKTINGIRYSVYRTFTESSDNGPVNHYCLVSPSGVGSYFMCSVVGPCMANGPYDP